MKSTNFNFGCTLCITFSPNLYTHTHIHIDIEREGPSLFSYTLSLNGVLSFLIFLVLPFLFFLTVVLLFPDLCPHSTSPIYLVWHFFIIINNILMLFIKRKRKKKERAQVNKFNIFFPLVPLFSPCLQNKRWKTKNNFQFYLLLFGIRSPPIESSNFYLDARYVHLKFK